jgi:hypothetical protein
MLAISKNRLLLLMWILLVVITPAFAQITAGIRGNVLDQSGGVVPDASVTLTTLETSLSKTTITDTAGIYSFTLLPVGSYSALDSWEIGGIITLASGLPFNVYTGIDQSLTGVGIDRPDLIGNPNLSASRPTAQKVSEYYNANAFGLAPLGQYGNFGRDVLIGPGQANVDFSALKNLPISEKLGTLQLRFEFFNFFNRPYFAISPYGSCTCDPNGNKLQSVAGIARQIQFGAKYTF